MASEELEQRYPAARGLAVGEYEVFECQLVTLNQFAEHGILPQRNHGAYKTQKCDTLIIGRLPSVYAVAVGERKQPGELTEANWVAYAEDLRKTKCAPIEAALGFVSDGITTRWINGRSPAVTEVSREDGAPMPVRVDWQDESFIKQFVDIVQNFNPATSQVRAKKPSNPESLAREIWQTTWRLKADQPEDCLATFVEIFVYKFLDDLGLIKTNDSGVRITVGDLLAVEKGKCYKYYKDHIRPHIKKLFPAGTDGYSIINGIVLEATNRDHNLMFYEMLKKFVRFGSLKNT